MSTEKIEIPKEILPKDGRFGCGPSLIRPSQLETIFTCGLMGTSHRQAPIKNLVASIKDRLAQLYHLPQGYEVVLGNGGASLFWASATACLIEKRAAHAVFGAFSKKFATETSRAPFLEESLIFTSDPGSAPEIAATEGIDFYAWAHQETSTGVINNQKPDFLQAQDALIAVDATSIAGAKTIDLNGIDVYYFSAQKALASDGGIWFALLSPRALERCEKLRNAPNRWVPDILSLPLAVENSRSNQTVNTPALATLIMLNEQLGYLLEQGGLSGAQAHCQTGSDLIYQWACAQPWATPFVNDPALRSHLVATIELEGVEAKKVLEILRTHHVVDLGGYRGIGKNQLRIGVFPNTEIANVQALLETLDYVIGILLG